jgi:hypothetical protein
MIPVAPANEPPEFDAKVRQPGLSAIDELVGRQPRLKRRGPKREKLADKEQDLPAGAFPAYWRAVLPDSIGPGWFVLNLNTLYVERGDAAPEAEWDRIDATLPVLNHRLCVQERGEYVRCYRLGPGAGGFDLAHLEYRAPFIASELRRQGQLVRGDT